MVKIRDLSAPDPLFPVRRKLRSNSLGLSRRRRSATVRHVTFGSRPSLAQAFTGDRSGCTAVLRTATAEQASRTISRRSINADARRGAGFGLAKRWREHGDRDAARQLVTSHLRLCQNQNRDELPRLWLADLGNDLEANIGLMKAVGGFEPDRSFRLANLCHLVGEGAGQQYVLNSWSLVKLGTSASQRKLFFKLRGAKRRIAAFDANLRPDQVALIAQNLGVPEQGGGRDGQLSTATSRSIRRFGRMTARRMAGLAGRRAHRRRRPRSPRKSRPTSAAYGASRGSACAQRSRAQRAFVRTTAEQGRSPSRRWRTAAASRTSRCDRSRCAPSRRCRARWSTWREHNEPPARHPPPSRAHADQRAHISWSRSHVEENSGRGRRVGTAGDGRVTTATPCRRAWRSEGRENRALR